MKDRLKAVFVTSNRFLIHWPLLVFLILFIDVKMVVKVAALLMIYFVNPDFKFGFRLRNPRLPLFYLIAIFIAVLNWILFGYFTRNYSLALATGISYWLLCILAVHQIRVIVQKTNIEILHRTLSLFFFLNFFFSLLNLLMIFLEIGFQNPFIYQGDYQKYFINTGDYIKGISFDTSTANALLNAFGVIYFLSKKKYLPTFGCMMVLILTASNLTNFILFAVFAYLFLFKSNKDQKAVMISCVMLLVIFLAKISPQNDHYISESFSKFFVKDKIPATKAQQTKRITDRPDSTLNSQERKQKIAQLYLDSLDRTQIAKQGVQVQAGFAAVPVIANDRPIAEEPDIHSAPFQRKDDTTEVQLKLFSFLQKRSDDPFRLVKNYNERMPGKLMGFFQIQHFFQQHPEKILTGNGVANFSSKLAFKTTGLGIAGSYPKKLSYVNDDFFFNHFAVYSYFFTRPAGAHSIMNSPASVYGQVLSEYGLAGFLSLLVFYIGFFFKYRKRFSYGMPLLFMLLAAFFVEYWFEQLSIVVLFELMIFIDIKEEAKAPVHE